MNGSQGGLAALASVLPSVCLCFTTVDVEYPADTAVAQPAAGQSTWCLRGLGAALQLPTGYTQLKSLATLGIIPRSKHDFLFIKEEVMQFLFIY